MHTHKTRRRTRLTRVFQALRRPAAGPERWLGELDGIDRRPSLQGGSAFRGGPSYPLGFHRLVAVTLAVATVFAIAASTATRASADIWHTRHRVDAVTCRQDLRRG